MTSRQQAMSRTPGTVLLKTVFKPLASLRLTIVCLACGMFIVFVGTLDQVQIGVYEAQLRYFKSFFLYFTLPGSQFRIPYFPGGYTLGAVLLVNLIAAHLARFKFTWKKSGIQILHSGLILLLIGQLVTSLFEEESQIQLDQGQTKNYSESPYFDELAIIDQSKPDSDEVITVPANRLIKGQTISLPVSGLQLQVDESYENAALINPNQLPSANYPHLRLGPMAVAVAIPKTYKQNEQNQPTAAVTLLKAGQSVGSWALSSGFPQPVQFKVGSDPFAIVFRPKRYYRPFSVTLEEFKHDRYAGTDVAKNFSSKVRLVDPAAHENREALIYMNHPLWYSDLILYQAGFGNNDQTTVLQVMKNPSRLIPYIACGMMALGLVIQFGMHLISFVRRRVIA
ncbi:MAG TPA: cytochrome c biogenesis protein ResB [Chthoniobacterales bacterium]|nr:cytochrome c biogenesis protein ResB [Chthoniobacterales bacterium]